MSKSISIRMPEQLIDDLKLLSGDGKYQKYMVSLLHDAVRTEFASKTKDIQRENDLLRGKIELLKKQSKCSHSWIGKSENQYCSKCGLSD